MCVWGGGGDKLVVDNAILVRGRSRTRLENAGEIWKLDLDLDSRSSRALGLVRI